MEKVYEIEFWRDKKGKRSIIYRQYQGKNLEYSFSKSVEWLLAESELDTDRGIFKIAKSLVDLADVIGERRLLRVSKSKRSSVKSD